MSLIDILVCSFCSFPHKMSASPDNPEILLSSWFDRISQLLNNDINNPTTTYHEIHIEIEVFFQKYNHTFNHARFATSGSLKRSIKRILETKQYSMLFQRFLTNPIWV